MRRKKNVTSEGQGQYATALEGLMQEILRAFYDVRALAQKGGYLEEWGSSAWGILQVLEADGPVSMAELARRRGCSRQNVQKLASESIAQQWIRLEPNVADRRTPLMVITDRGRRKLRSRRRAVDRSMVSLSRHLAAEDVAKAAATVARVRSLLTGRSTGSGPPDAGRA